MPAASFYAQINLFSGASFDDVPIGAIGLGSKNDGLYAKLPSTYESRLLTVADIGVSVAAFEHTHDFDKYQYWNCIGGGSTVQVISKFGVEFYPGSMINITGSNPLESVRRLTFSISDDVLRKSGTPAQNTIPYFYNENTLISSGDFWFSSSSKLLGLQHSSGSPSIELISLPSSPAHSGVLRFKRAYLGGEIPTGCTIMSVKANGAYQSGAYSTVGELLFISTEAFSESRKGTLFAIKTNTEGLNGTFDTRLLISGSGATRLQSCIVGDVGKDPVSVLESDGSFGAPITYTTSSLTLTGNHHTVIINGVHSITLPSASGCYKRIYVLINATSASRNIFTYISFSNASVNAIGAYQSITVQSDGTNWRRII